MWMMPKGPEVKQLGIVVNHKLNTIWEHNVAPKVLACLDNMGILWTSTNIVRIGVVGESAPVILWIGVKPKSLGSEDANTAAFRCLDILHEFGIIDVDVEIREASVTRLAGPKPPSPVHSFNPTVAIPDPLTHALGLPISAEATPYGVGTAIRLEFMERYLETVKGPNEKEAKERREVVKGMIKVAKQELYTSHNDADKRCTPATS